MFHSLVHNGFRIGWIAAAVAIALNGAFAAQAASPSELLEKAIYTEETVGNLDEAIKLYEKVIAESKSAQSAGAQALYRLGLCYLKKEQKTEAIAAFEKLVKQYPDEKELVAKARKHLPSELKLEPAPWQSGEVLEVNLKLPTGVDIGAYFYGVETDKHDGKDVWRCFNRALVTINGAASYSSVLCAKESFAPISSRWKHTLLGDVEAVYQPEQVKVTPRGKGKAYELEVERPVFDNEQGVHLFRRLPLAIGYKATLPIVTTLGGNKLDLEVEVTGKETLETPAGKFECFRLVLNIGQTFWISTDEHRWPVRFAAGGVTGDLARILERKTDARQKVSGEHYSGTIPGDWYAYQPEPMKDDRSVAYFLDAEAMGHAELNVAPRESLKEESRKSVRAWTDQGIAEFKKAYSDFKVREGSMQERKLNGQQVMSMIADYTQDDRKQVLYGFAIMTDDRAATLRTIAAAEQFDAFRKAVDTIVDSLQLK